MNRNKFIAGLSAIVSKPLTGTTEEFFVTIAAPRSNEGRNNKNS